MSSEEFDITATYLRFLEDDPDITMPIAAIESLVTLLKIKQPSTSAELITLLSGAISELKTSVPNAISLSAGCDLFMRFVLRNTHLYSDWESCRTNLVENGQLFIQRAKESRNKIAEIGLPFIKDDDIVLVHSYSRVVCNLLIRAFQKHIRFRVICTEARPTETAKSDTMAYLLRQAGIPVAMIYDSEVGFFMHKVDKVFVGAEGVAESGGIINHIGSYQMGVLAKNANKRFYVVAESHKFVRMFPLGPDDLSIKKKLEFSTEDKPIETRHLEFTPHEYITALITDLGVLTPSAVSEELIKMWYD
ncbi:Translation initiation factor eIF-2B subunit alpha [Komagataella phaffii CBS 7435]|uniref:Translation initiation factor eIF2B subunit alpha n=1 Tax=Komagataella phaffii (strain ATCC 76273 / CBS 7435 / CECT 11047 / NRRL Y-11430 / Wegner 21-1) TaxID=981350 RepID=F2R0F7_KOMPC|nr:Translation initiation factor eIF-2B subunit alpha [Komagataella phaffii CBS 7435]CCA41135.1 Translation initiation factor eIF-2B subunit alpha [Komagataella phaffii CBS 7435]